MHVPSSSQFGEMGSLTVQIMFLLVEVSIDVLYALFNMYIITFRCPSVVVL